MNRRKFLTTTGIGAGVTALASARILTTSFEHSVESLICKELGFLKLDPAGVRQFAAAYSTSKDRYYKLTIKAYNFLGIESSRSGLVHQLVSDYLLSTDFFMNKMDESRVIKHIGLYNPYMRRCAHPFSNAYYHT